MKRYLVVFLGLVILMSIIALGRFLQLRYTSTDASGQIVQITARTTDSYVDATQAVKDGLTQLTNSGGGVLFFGPGKYIIQETIVIPSNITIEGVGAGAVGPTMIVLGNNGDMNASGMALLSIASGAENVSIKDIELRSMTPGPNVYPRYDIDRIRDENTSGIRIDGSGSTQTRNITFQNVRIVNFTYGIDAGSTDGSNPVIDNVKFKNVVSEVNHWAMRVRSSNARNWDVQNLNIVEMGAGQSGVLLERTGKMSFLQLSCASTLHDADLCIDIRQRSGALHFLQAHVEGPADGVRVRTASTQPIYFENSAISGTIEAESILYSVANRLSLDNPVYRFNFTNGGSQSTLYTCGDVFTNGYPNPDENFPAEPYPGLATIPERCNFDVTELSDPFSTDYLPFASFEWIASGSSPSSSQLDVRNFGAVGDGVTDDTNAFRAAMQDIDYWSASTIIVPRGNYKITDTLQLEDGITFQGEDGSTIMFTPDNKPLFLVRVMASDSIIKRGIGIRNLSLVSTNVDTSNEKTTAIEFSGDRGASGDFTFSDLEISGFTRGMYAHNDNGQFDQHQPQLDSYLLRNLTFTNNGIAIEQKGQNISNWNFIDISVEDMRAGQKGIKVDGGGGIFRNLNCEGVSSQNLADSCVQLSRFGGAKFDNVTSSNTKHAFYVEWPMGWTPYPLMIVNSDLRDGLYVAGKMYVVSAGNIFADGGQTNPLGSRSTFFNVAGSDEPCDGRPVCNTNPGETSVISSCEDTFENPTGGTTETLTFVGLITTPRTCQFNQPDTTAPSVSVTQPVASTSVSGATVNISANATDNIAVVGVQFKINGNNLGAEDTSSPYTQSWNSTSVSNGAHTITAIARDAAGNSTTSSGVAVTVNNSVPVNVVVAPTISPNGGSFTSTQTITLATSTSGATIYYSINGSIPTTSSTQYTTPFSISANTTIKAIAIKSGMTNSGVTSATFTRSSTSSGGGGSSGGGTTTTPTTPNVVLPPNVIAGQVIKFANAPTIYLVRSSGLHPFDTWESYLAYQSQSGVQIIVREGSASSYTVSSILARTVLGQTNLPTTPATTLVEGTDFSCSGNPTVYYYYRSTKLAYSEAAVYEAWNGRNYAKIQVVAASNCASISSGGLVPLPEGAIVRVPGGSEIYMISGRTARPFTSLSAYQRDSAGKTTYTVSLPYLHTYSRGQNIY